MKVKELIEKLQREDPEAVAIVFADEKLTLMSKVGAVRAGELFERGVGYYAKETDTNNPNRKRQKTVLVF